MKICSMSERRPLMTRLNEIVGILGIIGVIFGAITFVKTCDSDTRSKSIGSVKDNLKHQKEHPSSPDSSANTQPIIKDHPDTEKRSENKKTPDFHTKKQITLDFTEDFSNYAVPQYR